MPWKANAINIELEAGNWNTYNFPNVNNDTLVLEDATQTLTNKRITPRVTSETSSATPTINTDNSDIHRITALAVDITSMSTNLSWTPTHWQQLIIEITGTATRSITRWTSFEGVFVPLPIATFGTVTWTGKFSYNSVTSKRSLMASTLPWLLDDWRTFANETWTYASSTTFTIAWDLTGKYQRGDRIKLTQTTVKYFVVLKVVHSAWTTTVTVTWWTNYTLASAAITLNYYSKQASPQWYPDRFTRTPSLQWFSANPTISYSAFSIIGSTCSMRVSCTVNGTSNQTYYRVDTPNSIQSVGQHQWSCHYPIDNWLTLDNCYCSIENTQTYVNIRRTADNDNRTANWGKRANMSITFTFTL